METYFDGQQTDERILYVASAHPFAKYIAIAKLILLVIFFLLMLFLLRAYVPMVGDMLVTVGTLLALGLLAAGIWWNVAVFQKTKTYITDRRIIRFDVVSPFFVTKRALFWSEALKAKGFAPNLIYRSLNIGTIDVLPVMNEHEDVRVADVYYFEDLANYIDKILFTFKTKPTDVTAIKPFVPKPRGHRD